MPLLDVHDLTLTLTAQRTASNPEGIVRPVDGVTFTLEEGESVALVGESGSGKSLTAATILGLSRSLPGARVSGGVLWNESEDGSRNLVSISRREMSRIRGSQIAMVFQDPLSCLNPLLRVGYQIREVLAKHCGLIGKPAAHRAEELLELVGVPQPGSRLLQYPHQLSGGLRQRVLLAVALAAQPRLLIADEPTTALDVTIQAQIIETLRSLQREQGLTVLFITHDLGVVAQLCSRVLVMYAGRIVEQATSREFFSVPSHPYSQGLLGSLPALHFHSGRNQAGSGLECIPGTPLDPASFPSGCRFHPRCQFCTDQCVAKYPPLMGVETQVAACWHIQRARERWLAAQRRLAS
ncbi:MAG: ABC transporter ATP-binding protein [bacterium]|nr:ABC transporter ATP-binding protein [bacterium]